MRSKCGLSVERVAQQEPIASYLAAWLLTQSALNAALVRYAKDKGAFITVRQRVGQTILRICDTANMHMDATSAQRCPS